MSRRSRNQSPLPLEAPVRVRLTDEDRARKGHALAVVGLSIRSHKRKLSTDTRATKEEIARLEKERGELEDALIADEELRPQGELFVADLPRDQAAAALATVAAVAGEPKPSEPHAFIATGDHGTARTMCQVCGAGKTDPIHGEQTASQPASGNGKGEHLAKASPAKVRPQTSARKAARA